MVSISADKYIIIYNYKLKHKIQITSVRSFIRQFYVYLSSTKHSI